MAPASTKAAKQRRLFNRKPERHGSFAMTQPNRAHATSSTAATRQVKDGVKPRNTLDGWQPEAYMYSDEIGEVGYVNNLKANSAADCELVLQEYDADADDWKDSEDVRAARVMKAFVSPHGGQSELIRRAFLHLDIAGETMLVGSPTKELGISTGIWWEFLSSEELVITRGNAKPRRKRDGISQGEDLDQDAYIARLYRSHPRFSDLADSPMRRVLGICSEVLTLTQMVSAIARSRLAAGILYVPEELSFAVDDESDEVLDADDEGYDENSIEPFLKDLEEHLKAPVEDRTSVASLVPLILRGPAEMKDKVGLIEIARNLDTWAQELRKEALSRLATGMDIDPAYLEGKSQVNHWGTWNIDNEFVMKHVAPTGSLVADFVTVAYLRPMLETFEAMSEDDALRFRVVFDTSKIMARSDEAANARLLHTELQLSDSSLRSSNGFDESDAPDPDELKRRMAWRLLEKAPVQLGPALGPLVGLDDVDWSKVTPQQIIGNPSNPTRPDLDGPDDVSGMQPPEQQSQEEAERIPGMSMLIERVATAADAAVDRAIDTAASRVVSKARKNLSIKDRIATVDKGRVLTVVAPADLGELGLNAGQLLAGAWDTVGLKVRGWVRSYLEQRGRDGLAADDIAALASSNLCSALDRLVSDRLHTQLSPNGNGLRVPHRLVIDALAHAGVG
ncbi:hypothetical protein [Desertimonas flava]|uniref:hypothetical protein n=1 Tax=Desertimonas flava TaxID=2064846 RepID=UPI000E3566E8|nr:hypothetical protein [Desertimonas flava]